MPAKLTDAYRDWINQIGDRVVPARIQVRVDRLVHGNPGHARQLLGGLAELKIDLGPGYRVYYTLQGEGLIILLAGGDNSTQESDIRFAIALLKDLQER